MIESYNCSHITQLRRKFITNGRREILVPRFGILGVFSGSSENGESFSKSESAISLNIYSSTDAALDHVCGGNFYDVKGPNERSGEVFKAHATAIIARGGRASTINFYAVVFTAPNSYRDVQPSERWDWNALREQVSQHGLRNSLLIAQMPTASTAQILGNTEAFEAQTSNIYKRQTLSGEFIIVNTLVD